MKKNIANLDFLHLAYIEMQLQPLANELQKKNFHLLETGDDSIVFDSSTGLLWVVINDEEVNIQKGKELASKCRIGGLVDWFLPTQEELIAFAKRKDNPMRVGQDFRLFDKGYWLCAEGRLDLDAGYLKVTGNNIGSSGNLILCHSATQASPLALVKLALEKGWRLMTDNDTDRLEHLRHPNPRFLLAMIDYLICRQPKLEDAQFTDPNKGLWEFWGLPEEELSQLAIRPRNPANDVRDGFVTIDFGTSSTVVAWDNNGRAELMRVGVKDFWEKQQALHYENPTVLEFIDFAAMQQGWQSQAYRPYVLWDQVRCSHEALHNWRNNESNPKVVGSILGKIKQWALRQDADLRLRVTDQQNGLEHELMPLIARNPVKGQAIAVSDTDPFDPVELYAWFLGMNINWRGRGLFLKYCMSFPVDYPQAVKDNILAAFRRGLQRSLPETLVGQPVFNEFSVEERASEPAAYAAIALPMLGIEPDSDSKVAYGVFDFGGGTADFDYGFYRLPDSEEEDEGWEVVFERCGSAGDKFLGGENLLENMAYRTFLHNIDQCRDKKIAFTRPLDAEGFAGSEMFLEKTRAATTNTLMLMSRLRPLWETGCLPDTSSGVQKIDLLTREGNKVSCEFAIPSEALEGYLKKRITEGVTKFFVALKQAFGKELPKHIHILLAGNASRSTIVLELFEESLAKTAMSPDAMLRGVVIDIQNEFIIASTQARPACAIPKWHFLNANGDLEIKVGDTFEVAFDLLEKVEMEKRSQDKTKRPPVALLIDDLLDEIQITTYPPLPLDDNDVYRPTGKTGVALGLLKLCPGGVIKIIDHDRHAAGNEAPFAYHVGRIRRSKFQAGIAQGTAYGQWHELGAPRERVFNLYYTHSPLAYTGTLEESNPELNKKVLHLAGDTPGQKVFACAIGPTKIKICTTTSKEAALQGDYDNLSELDLRE